MWEEILMLAVGNGLWAIISCLLLRYLLKDSKKREQKYTAIIETLVERLRVVDKIHEADEKILLILNAQTKNGKKKGLKQDECICETAEAKAEGL